jgi:hypothetical protein
VTCSGNSFASRVAGSLLKTVGLESLITQSVAEYESKIMELLNNPEQLTNIRKMLQANKLVTPLFDTAGYTRDFENLILSIHKKTPTIKVRVLICNNHASPSSLIRCFEETTKPYERYVEFLLCDYGNNT